VIAAAERLHARFKPEARRVLPFAPDFRAAKREVATGKKGFLILSRLWRELYKPTLEELYREAKSKGLLLTPDVAIEEMEQVFKSVFLYVEDKGSTGPKKDAAPGRRMYFRFDRIAFRQEAHHYAVDLFYNTYYSRKQETPRSPGKSAVGGRRWAAPERRIGVVSQPQMIRQVLLKRHGPLHADKIAEAVEKDFKVRMKRAEITSVIYRAIRGKKLFRKVGINTFGLLEKPAKRVTSREM